MNLQSIREISYTILAFLGLKDLSSYSRVNKLAQEHFNNSILWVMYVKTEDHESLQDLVLRLAKNNKAFLVTILSFCRSIIDVRTLHKAHSYAASNGTIEIVSALRNRALLLMGENNTLLERFPFIGNAVEEYTNNIPLFLARLTRDLANHETKEYYIALSSYSYHYFARRFGSEYIGELLANNLSKERLLWLSSSADPNMWTSIIRAVVKKRDIETLISIVNLYDEHPHFHQCYGEIRRSIYRYADKELLDRFPDSLKIRDIGRVPLHVESRDVFYEIYRSNARSILSLSGICVSPREWLHLTVLHIPETERKEIYKAAITNARENGYTYWSLELERLLKN